MTPEDDGLFERLAPPPGGADALRLRLRRERRRRRGRRVAGGLAVAAGVLALALVGADRLAQGRELPVHGELHPALIALGLQASPVEPASVPPGMRHRMALQRVPLDTDRVVFYYLAVLPEASSEPGG